MLLSIMVNAKSGLRCLEAQHIYMHSVWAYGIVLCSYMAYGIVLCSYITVFLYQQN
ncbi:hypothetical protein Hanom_Chr09g00847921 [Helianthus anomalus]